MKLGCVAVLMLIASASMGRAMAAAQLSPEQASVLELARTYSLEYTRKLPDFICTQVTDRESTGFTFTSVITSDRIEEQLTFVNQRERYEVMRINGRRVSGVQHMELPGAISAGEFGSLMHGIFDPKSHTAFGWDRMDRLRDRSVYVFGFQVPREAGVRMVHKESGQEIVASYGGFVFVDADTKTVIRITTHVDLPPKFPIKDAEETIDYRPVVIAGKDFTLPFHSEARMTYDRHKFVNRIDYTAYHKFTAKVIMRVDGDGAPLAPPTDQLPIQ